ncbi:MAG TPA: YiiX/YebB-like N1pC/P60 family cysteine hydrolase [Parafilimonas sp.]|nr:YiiX/YebB-like N1pC/P60 family cysteine hydrolase [Parafilimonas sp.]
MKQLAIILLTFYFLYESFGIAPKQTATIISGHTCVGPYAMIREGQSLLKEGDLVVRLNRDPASRYIKDLNPHDKKYSHSGIVLFENGHPFIFHMVSGEGNPGNELRKDPLSRFCDPRKNIAYAIFRYDMNSDEIKKLKDCINTWYKQEISFDFSFNLQSNDKMYCSEMISKALTKATNKRIQIETMKLTTNQAALFSAYTHLSFIYTSKLPIIPIDNLYTNPFCHLIKEYNYSIK